MKKGILAAVAVAAALTAAYVLPARYFTNRFLPRTWLNGHDVSQMTAQEAEEAVLSDADHYTLSLQGRGGVEAVLSGEDIGYQTRLEVPASALIAAQDPWRWPLALLGFDEREVPLVKEADEDKLRDAIYKSVLFNKENLAEPVNAAVVYDEDEERYTVKQDDGVMPILDAVTANAMEAVSDGLRDLDLEASEENYAKPRITADEPYLNSVAKRLNALTGAKIRLDFGEAVEEIGPALYHKWISFDEHGVSLSREQIAEYVAFLANRYDTKGKPHTFTTTRGEELTLEKEVTYGWSLDQEKTADLINRMIWAGRQETAEPVYRQTAASPDRENDIGDTYVEIDLDRQHLYLYEKGKMILETDFVSGKVMAGAGTPNGVFAIFGKQRHAILRGEDYETPVNYWMPFIRGVGLHDATWRGRFGGYLYVNGGSHGCVNLPLQKAAEIYDHVEIGTPVICYGGMTREEAVQWNRGEFTPAWELEEQKEAEAAEAEEESSGESGETEETEETSTTDTTKIEETSTTDTTKTEETSTSGTTEKTTETETSETTEQTTEG